jgi:hypothetical protein
MRILANRIAALPARVDAALGSVSPDAVRHRPAPGSWSAIEVTGHLVDKIEIWRSRAVAMIETDMALLEVQDQDAWVKSRAYQEADLEDVLWSLRRAWIGFAVELEALPTGAMERKGIHPELGTITVRDCIEIPLGSLDDHLRQLIDAGRS